MGQKILMWSIAGKCSMLCEVFDELEEEEEMAESLVLEESALPAPVSDDSMEGRDSEMEDEEAPVDPETMDEREEAPQEDNAATLSKRRHLFFVFIVSLL